MIFPKGSPNAQLQTIVEKHVDAMTRELAEAMLQPMLDQLMFSVTLPEVVEQQVRAKPAKPFNDTAPLYNGETRKWLCSRCNEFTDLRRRAVTTHMRFCEGGDTPLTPPASPKLKTKRRKMRKAKP